MTDPHISQFSCFGRARPFCDEQARFRTADGTCNNLQRPLLGSINTPFNRLRGAPPNYADGISAPRVALDGSQLPNARLVSFVTHPDVDVPSRTLTHMAMEWGQYVDHDSTLGAQPDIDCKGQCDGVQGECFGIPIPPNDPHFPFINVDCIFLKRDVPSVPSRCQQLGPREQINTLTSYLDASHIYGVTIAEQMAIRDTTNGDRGLLKARPNPASNFLKDLLPAMIGPEMCLAPNPVFEPCFRAGDIRSNENQGNDLLPSFLEFYIQMFIEDRQTDISICTMII